MLAECSPGAHWVLTGCSPHAHLVLTKALAGLLAAPAPIFQVNGSSPRRQTHIAKTNGTNIIPTSENKRPKPQSDSAGAIQMMFDTFRKNSKYHRICFPRGSHFQGGMVHVCVIISEKLLTGADVRIPMFVNYLFNILVFFWYYFGNVLFIWGAPCAPKGPSCVSLWRLGQLLWNPLGSPAELGMTLDHYITIMSPCATIM